MDKENALQQLEILMRRFQAEREEISRRTSTYNETQLRNDYLNPFLKIFGWDVNNEKALPQHLREVFHEANVNVEENDTLVPKNPDYAFRVGTSIKFFLEAKKPSVPVENDSKPSFQVRRYGWSGRHNISILSNFDKLIIYDCRYPPAHEDNSQVARLKMFSYEDYVERYDEIYSLISREAIYDGTLDRLFLETEVDYEKLSFDSLFLIQIEKWRLLIASDLHVNNGGLNNKEINFLVQRLLNRIMFLRVAEDRNLEAYERLKGVRDYDTLKHLFRQADIKYDSGLFDFIEDKLSLGIVINPEILVSIFSELYYPQSPYDFSVVDANILGEIYDQFLGREIIFHQEHGVQIVEKPEVVASSGVVPTPKYIVDEIVKKTLDLRFKDLSVEDAKKIRVCDLCCGSGVFLVSAFDYIVNWHIQEYVSQGAANFPLSIYQDSGLLWRLTIVEKQKILLNNIFGVDIDSQAVEVAKFSMLLKMLEGENVENLKSNLDDGLRALPNLDKNIKCGNSLVDNKYFELFPDDLEQDLIAEKINAFSWNEEFPEIMNDSGFDVILGNPPYVRIQNMMFYSEKEVEYYRNDIAGYQSVQQDSFDKYYLFIERSLNLLKEDGYLGCIVPNKFFTIASGAQLRSFIASGRYLSQIVHFGVQQVFPNRSTYTSIIIFDKSGTESFTVARVDDLISFQVGGRVSQTEYLTPQFTRAPWVFIREEAQRVFRKLHSLNVSSLDTMTDIFVGLQTSADKIYIIKNDEIVNIKDGIITFSKLGRKWSVEESILAPCLYDAKLFPYTQVQSNARIIFPYNLVGAQANLYSAREMKRDFPHCWKYLIAHRELLEARNIAGGDDIQWYQYGRSQSLTKFDGQIKLIWSVLSQNAPYTFDANNVKFTGGGNGPYYSLRMKENRQESIFFVLAVISHPVFEALVRVRSSMFRGDYYSHGKQFLQQLPILNPSELSRSDQKIYEGVVRDAQLIIRLNADIQKEGIPQKIRILERQKKVLLERMENGVSALYRLEYNDLVAVSHDNLYITGSPEGE